MMQAKKLEIRVQFYRSYEGGPVHASAYAVGSSRAKRRTLCGMNPEGLRKLAPFQPGDRRDPFFNGVACEVCAERLTF